MSSPYEWHSRIRCKKCGWHAECPSREPLFCFFDCCAGCGNPFRLGSFKWSLDDWEMLTMRYRRSRLWPPSEWFTGEWLTLTDAETRSAEGEQ